MADASVTAEEPPKKSSLGLLLGLVLALLGGGAGYFVMSGGILSGGFSNKVEDEAAGDIAFIPVDPLTVPIGNPRDQRFLRFRAQLEVPSSHKGDVEAMLPRVVDVLNTYLRSITMSDVEDPASLLTLRSQMRRRIDLVVGGDKVHDLLVMEFVVN